MPAGVLHVIAILAAPIGAPLSASATSGVPWGAGASTPLLALALVLAGLIGILVVVVAVRRPRPARSPEARPTSPVEPEADPLAARLEERAVRRAKVRLDLHPAPSSTGEAGARRTRKGPERRERRSRG